MAFLTVPSAIAVAAAALVVGRHRVARAMPRLLGALVVVDLVVFNVFIQGVPDPHAATSAHDAWADAVADAVTDLGPGPGGGLPRMAIFDPDRYYPFQTNRLGQPDLTILRHLVSVQGYGAVVDAGYDRSTGTHLQLNMTPAGLADGTFSSLDLGVLVSVPEYFVHLVTAPPEVPATSTAPGSVRLPPVGPDPAAARRPHTAATAPGAYVDAPAPRTVVSLVPGRDRVQFFGTVLSVTSVTVPVSRLPGTPDGASTLRVGVLSPNGSRTTWIGAAALGPGRATTVTVAGARAVPGAGIVLQASGAAGAGAAVVRTEGQGTYRVDGSLRDDVAPGRWRFDGTIGPFSVFTESVAGMAWVQGAAGGSAHVVSSTPWGAVTVRVHTPRPATLVRSEEFTTGWRATVRPVVPAGSAQPGAGRAVTVKRHGLVQAVAVPAGTSLVSFSYSPHRVDEGVGASAAGVLALLALWRWPRVRPRLVRWWRALSAGRRRRRRSASSYSACSERHSVSVRACTWVRGTRPLCRALGGGEGLAHHHVDLHGAHELRALGHGRGRAPDADGHYHRTGAGRQEGGPLVEVLHHRTHPPGPLGKQDEHVAALEHVLGPVQGQAVGRLAVHGERPHGVEERGQQARPPHLVLGHVEDLAPA